MLLALDTATPLTTVALIRDGAVVAERSHHDPRRHAELLTCFIEQVMVESGSPLSDVGTVAVGVGPGAFTGLRVGLMTARVLGMTLSIPVRGVMTLDALAFAADLSEPFAVVTDARRSEVFWALYDGDGTRTSGPSVGSPSSVAAEVGSRPCLGAGATPFADQFVDVREPALPAAGAMGLLASQRISAGEALLPPDPLYLRRPDVAAATAPKSVLR